MQPFQPLPLPTTSKHSRTSLFLLWNLLLFPKCLLAWQIFLTLLYTTNIILDLQLSTHYLSCPISSSPYLYYLYFTPILVDCPTQLICTFHLLCSLTKLKEHSREISWLIGDWTIFYLTAALSRTRPHLKSHYVPYI